MSADPKASKPSESDQLEAATDQAISACGGDARDAVKALIVANDFLEALWKNCGPMCQRDTRAATTTDDSKPTPAEARTMAEVTYFVALPIAIHDGVAAASRPNASERGCNARRR